MIMILRACGLLYLLSALWCVFQADAAAAFLGLGLDSSLARSEFFSVYGGLQAGLGVAMVMSSFKPAYLEAALFFSAVFSACLAIFRLISFFVFGWTDAALMMLVIEAGLAVALVYGWCKHRS